MGGEVGILVKPPSRRAAVEAAEGVRRLRPQALLLGLPEDLEDLIAELASGSGFDEFEQMVERKFPSSECFLIKEYEPVLKAIPDLSVLVDVCCYKDSASFRRSVEKSVDLAVLTLRAAVSGRVNVEDWLRLLKADVEAAESGLEKEVERISEMAWEYDRVVCISDFTARKIREKLEEEGVKPWIRYLGQPYHFTPLEVLKRKLARGDVDKEEAEELIREHVKFIREYVYRKSFPEAVEEWSEKNLYWIPRSRDMGH